MHQFRWSVHEEDFSHTGKNLWSKGKEINLGAIFSIPKIAFSTEVRVESPTKLEFAQPKRWISREDQPACCLFWFGSFLFPQTFLKVLVSPWCGIEKRNVSTLHGISLPNSTDTAMLPTCYHKGDNLRMACFINKCIIALPFSISLIFLTLR